jgi:hypothetical protein
MRWRVFLFQARARKVALGYSWVTTEKEFAGYPLMFAMPGFSIDKGAVAGVQLGHARK